jgi:dTDP-4-amino-4,6-dideoxygalactose transaminase
MTFPQRQLEEQRESIPFIDLKAQQTRIRPQIDAAIKRVLDHGGYIMGPEVYELEKQLAEFCGVKHAISCANGTDALGLGLMAKNVGVGDAIFVPSFTFAATAEVVAWMGATPIFIDSLEDTYNIDPKSLELGIIAAKKAGLKAKGIIPVDLFGQPADYDVIQTIADEHGLFVIADGAQSFGATYKGRKVGSIGDMATTSFFPAKPLGCYGDGGAIFTNDDELASVIKSLRVHGQGTDKYDNVNIGMNGRLDTIQAAILIEKLRIFPDELSTRQKAADQYSDALKSLVEVPAVLSNATSAWAQYTVRLPKNINRSTMITNLKESGVPTMIYYPIPLHLQKAYNAFYLKCPTLLSQCEALSTSVLSFPMCANVGKNLPYIIEKIKESIWECQK